MSPQLSGTNEREKYRQINRDKEAMPRVDEVELVTSNGYARVRLQSSESEDAEDKIDLGLVGEKVKVKLPGGDLVVEWRPGSSVILEGPIETVFSGTWVDSTH